MNKSGADDCPQSAQPHCCICLRQGRDAAGTTRGKRRRWRRAMSRAVASKSGQRLVRNTFSLHSGKGARSSEAAALAGGSVSEAGGAPARRARAQVAGGALVEGCPASTEEAASSRAAASAARCSVQAAVRPASVAAWRWPARWARKGCSPVSGIAQSFHVQTQSARAVLKWREPRRCWSRHTGPLVCGIPQRAHPQSSSVLKAEGMDQCHASPTVLSTTGCCALLHATTGLGIARQYQGECAAYSVGEVNSLQGLLPTDR